MRITTILAALAFFLFSGTAFAQIETIAKSAFIIDDGTGTVLLDKAADEHMPTSSMSKVMSMYIVFEALKDGRLKLDDDIIVSEKAWRMQGSKMFIKVGDRVRVEDLIRGVIIQSGNDAVVALAEGVSGDEQIFVDAMNATAQELGLKESHFMNASGWPDPDHYSTPRDLATLASRIIKDFPEHFHYFSEKSFTYNKIKQQNRDPLLGRVPGADGLKTGHTEVAGYGLMGTAHRDGRRVIMVMNGMNSEKERVTEGVRLMEWAFRSFENVKVVSKGDVIEDVPVWLGKSETVPLTAGEDFTVLVPHAQRGDIKLGVRYMSPLKAPLKAGDEAGSLQIDIPGQAPAVLKLVAGADVERKGIFGRVRDRAIHLLTGKI